jgi:hypothetical protein
VKGLLDGRPILKTMAQDREFWQLAGFDHSGGRYWGFKLPRSGLLEPGAVADSVPSRQIPGVNLIKAGGFKERKKDEAE